MQTIEEMQKQQKKPDIEYPCIWPYKIIGENPDLIKDAIEKCCYPNNVKINFSHTSSGGKYHSFSAKVEVTSEELRLAIFDKLKEHPSLKMIL
ncbi:MAG: DUF493 domain-containing protein [Desulfotalea sp.]